MTELPPSKSQFEQDVETIVHGAAAGVDTITKANAWTALVGFFTALPGLVQMALAFWGYINKITGNNPGALMAKFGGALGDLSQAQTEADKNAALAKLSDLFTRL